MRKTHRGLPASRAPGQAGAMPARILVLALALALAAAPPLRAQDLTGHGGPVRALLPLGDGLVSGGFDHALILWDPARARAAWATRWHRAAITALAPMPDGARFLSGAEDGRVAIWSPGRAEPDLVLEGHGAPVGALAARGGVVLSAGWDGVARLWDAASGASLRVLAGHQGTVNAAAFLPTGAAVTAGQDGTVREWGADGAGKILAEFGVPQNALLALPGGTLAAAGADGTVRLITPAGAVGEIVAGARPVVALAASPDGTLLAAATVGGGVGLWEVATGRPRGALDGPGLPVWSLAFAPDGGTLWSGGQDRRVRRWEAATARPLGPIAPDPADGAATPRDPEGARVFRACSACHALSATAPPMAGPHLQNLFGRRMGAVAGYAYSERLARGDLVWTRETVAELFSRGPDEMLPGTTMPLQVVSDRAELEALLRFLDDAPGAPR